MRTEGFLADYFDEPGTEGTLWTLVPDPMPADGDSRDHLVFLQGGDHLTIVAADGTVAFEGVLDADHETGWQPWPSASGPDDKAHGQPAALGLWIHWTQRGFQPDDWARFFVRAEGEPRFLAVVERAEKVSSS